MGIKKSLTLATLFLIVLCAVNAIRASAQRVTRNDEWAPTAAYGVPVWIAFNDLAAAAVKRRTILVFIEPQHFTPENIRKLFTNLAAAYKEPALLEVTVFSDKPMLQRAINNLSGAIIDWADTPEGREAAKKWAEAYYPLPSGYYRAHYSRIARSYRIPGKGFVPWYMDETYSYSPDPAKPEMVRVVLQGKPSSLPYSGDPDTDLLMAAREGQAEKVRSLLSEGAKVNARDEEGKTPLMIAALSGKDLPTVKFLIANGADVNAKNKKNDTALIYAASNREADILQALLAAGADINHQNDNGYSALIMAVAVPFRLACLKALLAAGADVEAKNDSGETALIKAAGHKEPEAAEMVKALLAKGANVNAPGRNDETALMRAAGVGQLEAVRLLLEKGAGVNARNLDRETALMYAADEETTRLLLSKGAAINAKNKRDETALMYAAQRRAVAKARVLIEQGADVRAKSQQGETALDIANSTYGSNGAMLDLLEAAEAKQPNGERRDNESPGGQPRLVVKRDPQAQCCEEISSVSFSPDGRVIAAKPYRSAFAGNHGIIFWDARSGKLIKSIEGEREGVISIQFDADGRSVSSEYGKRWDMETGKLNQTAGGPPDDATVYSATFSADGRISASSEKKIGERARITIRDATSGQVLRSLATDTAISELKLSADGKRLAGVIRGSTNQLVIWDVATGEATQKMDVGGPIFIDLTISHDGKMLAASSSDLTKKGVSVTVFDVSTGKAIHNLSGYSAVAFSVAFSPDDKLLATGGGDATVRLWDATSGTLLRTMEGHTQLARAVAFNSSGKLLASGGGKNETRIWSVSTGKLLVTLVAFTDGNWIAYTPDGYYNCSEAATNYITWHVGKDVYDEAKYRAQFFKPQVIAERLRD
ncbi:MAG TPA: ankyrin repeat domain-containing protein [Blastocatellia bacterium]|nr:ankyrin repeat domain-containing protein [Blastocatellia bacterium]